MKGKQRIFIAIVTVFLFSCVTIANAGIIQNKFHKEMNKNFIPSELLLLESKISNFVNNTFPHIPLKVHDTLVELIYLIYVSLTIIGGHNNLTILLAKIISAFFVIPLIAIENGMSSGGLIAEIFRTNFDNMNINIENMLYYFGILAIIMIPIYYTFAFCLSIGICIANLPLILADGFMQDVYDTYQAVEWWEE